MEQIKHRKKASITDILAMAALVTLLLLSFLGFFAAAWYVRVYGRIGFDSILFTLTGGLGGVDVGLVKDYLFSGALPAAVCTALVSSLLFFVKKPVRIRGKQLLPLRLPLAAAISLVLSLCLLIQAAFSS